MERVGDAIATSNAGWSFSGDASVHFEQHVRKSVPLYELSHDLVASLSDFFLSEGSLCYDLGCGTGELTAKLARRHQGKDIQFVGIDCEADMIDRAKARCNDLDSVELRCENLLDLDWNRADFIIAHYTLQFVRPKHRQTLFNRIYEALHWGGGFVLFEKVRGPDARFQDIATTLYADFKLENGFTGDEIVAKTRSLKGVLEPFSTAGNLGLMERAGFVDIATVMKYICFEGFLAIK